MQSAGSSDTGHLILLFVVKFNIIDETSQQHSTDQYSVEYTYSSIPAKLSVQASEQPTIDVPPQEALLALLAVAASIRASLILHIFIFSAVADTR